MCVTYIIISNMKTGDHNIIILLQIGVLIVDYAE